MDQPGRHVTTDTDTRHVARVLVTLNTSCSTHRPSQYGPHSGFFLTTSLLSPQLSSSLHNNVKMFVTKGKSYLFRLLFPKINQFRTCAAFDLITQQRSITSFFFKRYRHTLTVTCSNYTRTTIFVT